MKQKHVFAVVCRTVGAHPLLSAGLLLSAVGAIGFALVPPLILEQIVNRLKQPQNAFAPALFYFAALTLSGLFDAAQEMAITVFGQKITRAVRHELCARLDRMPAPYFTTHEAGATVSRFVGDVDTVEALFASGIISMLVDACKMIGVLVIIFVKSPGLGLLMAAVTPLVFALTRAVQKRMLRAQLAHRAAVARVTGHVPETIRCIRTIHTFRREAYMEQEYRGRIEESYAAMEKSNFYDAIYSPVILFLRTVIIACMMVLAATGGPMQQLFGMSVGTAVAVIAYVGRVFDPLESIGMEIQNIQSAVAGVQRIEEFLCEPERPRPDNFLSPEQLSVRAADPGFGLAGTPQAAHPVLELKNVCFGYDPAQPVLCGLNLAVRPGELVTLAGRTGAGKSTMFKLLLGFYTPDAGTVRVFGQDAVKLPDAWKRRVFGYVEQSFHAVPGTVGDQISVFDPSVSAEQVVRAAQLTGIHEVLAALPDGYGTQYSDALFSQGQRQLIAIARAIAADPPVLLLDEITANLDTETELRVLSALRSASANRTVLSVSHRLYEHSGGRIVQI